MAPKSSKRAKPSRTHQSSDSDSTMGFGGAKFTSSEAEIEYNRLMKKTIIKERVFVPNSDDGKLVSMIEELEWVTFCEAPCSVPLSIVREFYANAKADKNGYTVVRGITVDYTPMAIRQVLETPEKPDDDEVEDWASKPRAEIDLDIMIEEICRPGTQWLYKKGTTEQVSFPASALNKYARAWNLFLCANLSPCMHSNEVTVQRAILLYGILNEKYLDVGYLINQNMIRFMRGVTSGGIPHASVVTRLCRAVGVRWSSDEPLQHPSTPIDHAAIVRLKEWRGGRPDLKGLGYVDIYVTDEGTPPLPASPGHDTDEAGPSHTQMTQDPVVFSDVQYRRLLRHFDASYDSHRQFASDLTQTLDGVFQQQGIQVTWPIFGAHTVYPPPDTPPEGGADADI